MTDPAKEEITIPLSGVSTAGQPDETQIGGSEKLHTPFSQNPLASPASTTV
jgi:hypothetical protein